LKYLNRGSYFREIVCFMPSHLTHFRIRFSTIQPSGGRRDELLNLTWSDIDFEIQTVRFVPKRSSEVILAWEPKDHQIREVPIPSETLQLLVNLQLETEEASPYVFISKARLLHILKRRSQGNWEPDSEIINNLIRDLKVTCRHAGANPFTVHDLRRSCITNWSKKLPIQTVQQLAGHPSIETTRKILYLGPTV